MPWQDKIESAASHEELLALTRAYLQGWSREAMLEIPAGCRPVMVFGVEDLAFWHQRLVDGYCDGPARGPEGMPVRRMLAFFSRALDRAAELEGVPPIRDYYTAVRLFSSRRSPRLYSAG